MPPAWKTYIDASVDCCCMTKISVDRTCTETKGFCKTISIQETSPGTVNGYCVRKKSSEMFIYCVDVF